MTAALLNKLLYFAILLAMYFCLELTGVTLCNCMFIYYKAFSKILFIPLAITRILG